VKFFIDETVQNNLAFEAEPAITQLPTTEREYYRKQVADRIEKLQNNSISQNSTHPEIRTLRSIQAKLKNNNMITTADKDIHNNVLLIKTRSRCKIMT